MKPIYLLLLSLLGTTTLPAQTDYAAADAAARNVPKGKFETPAVLAKAICQGLPDETQKARALFTWVAENLRYDLSMIGKKGPEAYSQEEYEAKRIKTAFRHRKGICMDFALLYRDMAQAVGLECGYIVGHSKGSSLGGWNSHAWNAVKINDKWQLIDATWGSGHAENDKFLRHLQSGYFFTEPRLFALDHFPDDEKWQLLDTPIDKNTFKKQFSIEYGNLEKGIFDAEPFGPLKKNPDGKIKLRIKVGTPAEVYRLEMNGRSIPHEYTAEGGWIQFVFKPNASRQLQIWAGEKNSKGTLTTLIGVFPVVE